MKTVRRDCPSALRATRITAAGSSVISSHAARKVSGSRAQKSAREREQERAGEKSDSATAGGGLDVAQREDERRQRDHAERPQEESAQAVDAEAEGELAREGRAERVAAREHPEPGDGDDRSAGRLGRDSEREARARGGEERAERDRAQPGDEQAAVRTVELFQDRLLLGQPSADDVATGREQVEHAQVVDAVVDARPSRRDSRARCGEAPQGAARCRSSRSELCLERPDRALAVTQQLEDADRAGARGRERGLP